MDFAALPPEVNSARLYAGPGPGPMLAAAQAWSGLAAELRSAAAGYGSVVSGLTGGSWLGPASRAMAAAAASYVGWMNNTAAQAEQVGAQAQAAAAAYESAFAGVVPPAMIAANRAQLAALVATNVFGQNSAAIAATEAHYEQMWAQDAAAMYGYAGASAAASRLTPFTAPAPTTTGAGLAAQGAADAAVSGSSQATTASTLSSLSSLLTGALSGTNGSAVGTFLGGNFFSTMVVNGAIAGGPFNPQFLIMSTVASINAMNTLNAKMSPAASTLLPGLGGLLGLPSGGAVPPAGVSEASAGLGQAGRMGLLSVPPSWAAAASSPWDSALGATPLVAPPAAAAGGPGGVASPLAQAAGRLRRPIPKYGFRPRVMPRPPAAG